MLALDGGQWSVSYHGHFTPAKRTHSTHSTGDWKSKFDDSHVVQKWAVTYPCEHFFFKWTSSFSSSGPGAYAPDAPQPIGLLCDPSPPRDF
jgi:hypothetical protein